MTNKHSKKLGLLTNLLVKNATYLGLSESTIQNMLQLAFESNPGLKIVIKHKSNKKMGMKCKHYDRMPHHPLPNCVRYENETSKLDMIGALFGKAKRQDKGVRTMWNGRNIRANRYVEYRLNQIGHYRDRGQNRYYWRHALKLLESPAFQVMAFNYVCHNWHREMSLGEAKKIQNNVKDLVEDLKIEINMRRVYIKKANGKWRPLGVPTKAWRVYLHMLNVLVVWFRMGSDPHQHAYKPKSGVHTAWKDLLERVENPNIYEFDLESFFPSVSLRGMRDILIQELGMPEIVAGLLLEINRSITKLSKEDKLPEWSDRQVLLNTSGDPNPNLPLDIQRLIIEVQSFSNISADQTEAALKEVLPEGWSVYKDTGVPQGSAISCGLATVNLHYIWKTLGDQLLMYADDGLVFPRDNQSVKVEDLDRGIKQNQSKSGWVKRNGEWKKPLKFLGLEYVPATKEEPSKIRANTRNGSQKEYTLDKMFLVYLLNERDLLMWASSSPEWDSCNPETEDENVVFIKDERGRTLLEELTYNGKRKKVAQGPKSVVKVSKSILSSITEDLKANAGIQTWIEHAARRFLSLPNPLKQLFETHGLQILSNLYDNREDTLIQAACENRLTCSKSSWAYRKLGSMIYKKLYEFIPSDESLFWINNQILKRKYRADSENKASATNCSSNWEQITQSKVYLEIWRNCFEMKDRTPRTFRGIAKVIEKEMRNWLRGLTLNIQNISTYAVEDLLDSSLFNPTRRKNDWKSRIKFSKMNRVLTEGLSEDELIAKGIKMEKNLRKEFYRQFGKRLEQLSVKPLA